MSFHQIMHPTVKLQLVLIPSTAIQILTPLCRIITRKIDLKCSKLLNGQSSLERIHTHLNTENTRAILPIARILFLMTSLRKLAALPARQPDWVKRTREKKKHTKWLIQVLQQNCSVLSKCFQVDLKTPHVREEKMKTQCARFKQLVFGLGFWIFL